MDTPTTTHPTPDERLMAGVSHLLGPLGALLFYALKKDQSPFVRFQSLQALAFDLLAMLAGMAFGACMAVGLVVLLPAGMFYLADQAASPEWAFLFPMLFPMAVMLLVFPLSLAVFGLRLWAAISIFKGRDFHYPWLGARVQYFLEN